MSLSKVAVAGCSLGGLFFAGWQFLDRSLYRDSEEKDSIVQVCMRVNMVLACAGLLLKASKNATIALQGWLACSKP